MIHHSAMITFKRGFHWQTGFESDSTDRYREVEFVGSARPDLHKHRYHTVFPPRKRSNPLKLKREVRRPRPSKIHRFIFQPETPGRDPTSSHNQASGSLEAFLTGEKTRGDTKGNNTEKKCLNSRFLSVKSLVSVTYLNLLISIVGERFTKIFVQNWMFRKQFVAQLSHLEFIGMPSSEYLPLSGEKNASTHILRVKPDLTDFANFAPWIDLSTLQSGESQSRSNSWTIKNEEEQWRSGYCTVAVAFLVAENVGADILVQPGYGQPQPMQQIESITQPMNVQSPVPESTEMRQLQSVDPGYHLELHPVYGNLQHPANAISYQLMQQYQMPYLSKANKRLIAAQLNGLGLNGMHGPLPTEYLPLAVHSRHRRSSGDESDSRAEKENLGKVDMAPKQTLNEDVPLVVDLQSQNGVATKNLDEKRVGVRQSDTGRTSVGATLLGLNPANMYPVYHQYPSLETGPQNTIFNTHQQIIGDQTHPQILSKVNSRATTPQHTVLLQQPSPQQSSALVQQQQSGMALNSVANKQRNVPDPRPDSITAQSSKLETMDDYNEPRMAKNDEQTTTLNDDILGTHRTKYNTKIKQHIHQHGMLPTNYAMTGGCSCPCANTGYNVVYNDGMSNSFTPGQTNVPQNVQVYQLPSVQGTNYSPNTGYVVQPYNYPASNNWEYPSTSEPYRICLHNEDNVPRVTYQMM
ncbi:uncharacterized protein LOC143147880 [Ptiloglossa arizonensis]|uniref:uncharacterized protein LOC143147880 n=1 Tax=Ptiloglossa arizonensis TaxID=3350558 RepID=UPI003F9EDC7D